VSEAEAKQEAAIKSALREYLAKGIYPSPFATVLCITYEENTYRVSRRGGAPELFSVLYMLSFCMERVGEAGRKESAELLRTIAPGNILEIVRIEGCENLINDLALLAYRVGQLEPDLEDFDPLGAKLEVVY